MVSAIPIDPRVIVLYGAIQAITEVLSRTRYDAEDYARDMAEIEELAHHALKTMEALP